MDSIFGIILIVLLAVSGYSIGFGVNLKKLYGWLQVLSGFLLGLFMGTNLPERLIAAVFLAGCILLLGPIAWKRQQAAIELLKARGSSVSYLKRLSRRHNCPRCGSLLPRFRIPNSVSQLLYGGSTCKQCGCEIDRTGHEITPT